MPICMLSPHASLLNDNQSVANRVRLPDLSAPIIDRRGPLATPLHNICDAFAAAKSAFEKSDYVAAARLFRPLAEQGDAPAQTIVPQSFTEAFNSSRKAAEQGDAEGQSDLGFMYSLGQGVLQDYIEAAKWFRKAAICSATCTLSAEECRETISARTCGLTYRRRQASRRPEKYILLSISCALVWPWSAAFRYHFAASEKSCGKPKPLS
jgi:hypothetical protein